MCQAILFELRLCCIRSMGACLSKQGGHVFLRLCFSIPSSIFTADLNFIIHSGEEKK